MRSSLLIALCLTRIATAVPNLWSANNWPTRAPIHAWLEPAARLISTANSESACGELVGEVTCVTATTVFGVTIPITPTLVPLDPVGTTTVLELTTTVVTYSGSSVESRISSECSSQVLGRTTSKESITATSAASGAPLKSSNMIESTAISQATSSISSSGSITDGSESSTSTQSPNAASTSTSKSPNDTLPMDGINSPSTPLSLDAKVGICSAGVMFFLFVLVTSIYLIRRQRQKRHTPRYRRPLEPRPSIQRQNSPYGFGGTRNTLARVFSRPSKHRSGSQPLSPMSHLSQYPSPHIGADSTALITSWVPQKPVRRYDCVILSPEAQEFREHTEYVQELDERGDGDGRSFDGYGGSAGSAESAGSVVEGYSVLGICDGDRVSRAGTRASTICTLGAKSEIDSKTVGGTW